MWAGEAPAAEPAGRSASLTRALEKVRVTQFEIVDSEEGPLTRGTGTAVYRNNGTCTPYSVTLRDEQGREMTIDVDALGSVRTEMK